MLHLMPLCLVPTVFYYVYGLAGVHVKHGEQVAHELALPSV